MDSIYNVEAIKEYFKKKKKKKKKKYIYIYIYIYNFFLNNS